MEKMNLLVFLTFVLLVPLAYSVQQQDVFVLRLNYDKGAIFLDSIKVMKGYYYDTKESATEDFYTLKVKSFKNGILFEKKFTFPLEIFSEPLPEWFDEKGRQIYFPTPEEAGHVILDKASRELIFPYFKNAKAIEIYDNKDVKTLEIDVLIFADLCGDNVCQEEKENAQNCPDDCLKKPLSNWSLFIGIIILIALIFIIKYLKRKK